MVGSPKSEAGVRDVAIPPHLLPMLKAHVSVMPMRGKDALLFPATDGVSHIAPSTLYRVFYPARKAAGGRTFGGTTSGIPGQRWPHRPVRRWPNSGPSRSPTPQAALAYQHAAQGRDAEIAAALSRITEGASGFIDRSEALSHHNRSHLSSGLPNGDVSEARISDCQRHWPSRKLGDRNPESRCARSRPPRRRCSPADRPEGEPASQTLATRA